MARNPKPERKKLKPYITMQRKVTRAFARALGIDQRRLRKAKVNWKDPKPMNISSRNEFIERVQADHQSMWTQWLK